MAIDPAANKMYWADLGTDTIKSANLDGTGAGTLVGSAGNDDPVGVAIDPAGNKIYWSNEGAGSTIRFANLDDGSSVGTLIGPPNATNPLGVAIDPAANKIYWADLGSDSIKSRKPERRLERADPGRVRRRRPGRRGDRPPGEQDPLGRLL